MKKEIGFILVLLVGFAAFVMGFPGMSHAQPNAEAKKCHKDNGKANIKKVTKEVAGEDAIAIFVLKADGSIQVMEGPNKSAKKPKKDGGGLIDEQPASSTDGPVPQEVKDDFPSNATTVKTGTITTYVGDTCTNVNGTWYCW